MLAWAAGRLQNDCGTFRKHFTKPGNDLMADSVVHLLKRIIWHGFAPVIIHVVEDLFDLIGSDFCSTNALENFHCNVGPFA